jgi:hypothetical protein
MMIYKCSSKYVMYKGVSQWTKQSVTKYDVDICDFLLKFQWYLCKSHIKCCSLAFVMYESDNKMTLDVSNGLLPVPIVRF